MTRAAKKVQTRTALVNAGAELFAARGYEAVTVDEVASAAGVSRRTLFRYFPSKDALVFHWQDEDLSRFSAALTATGMPAVRSALLAVGAAYAASAPERLAQYRIVLASPALVAREVDLDRRWEAVIAAGLGGDRAARFHAGALIGLVRAVLREWLDGDCQDDLLSMADEALSTLTRMDP